jgi:hypothetical protein
VNPAKETITALLAVLAEERAAIRTLDTNAIVKAANDKEALAVRMSSMSVEQLTPAAAEIVTLRAELRRNGILLAHARACVARAFDIVAPRQSGGLRGRLRAKV